MAQEIVNRLHASVKCLGTGVIVARNAEVLSIVRNGAGDYTITLVEGLGGAEGVIDASVDDTAARSLIVERVSDVAWRLRTFSSVAAAIDSGFCWGVHRISSTAGI
jgi:hypothetical protein